MSKHLYGWGKYRIWKQKESLPYPLQKPKGIWRGKCRLCNYQTQYWNWGAVKGALEFHDWTGCHVYKSVQPLLDRLYEKAMEEERENQSGKIVPDQADKTCK